MVDDRIRPALESGAGIGSSKPVLVVVDEIDGATGAGDNVCLTRILVFQFACLDGVKSLQVSSRNSLR